jgi:hypothetical protein
MAIFKLSSIEYGFLIAQIVVSVVTATVAFVLDYTETGWVVVGLNAIVFIIYLYDVFILKLHVDLKDITGEMRNKIAYVCGTSALIWGGAFFCMQLIFGKTDYGTPSSHFFSLGGWGDPGRIVIMAISIDSPGKYLFVATYSVWRAYTGRVLFLFFSGYVNSVAHVGQAFAKIRCLDSEHSLAIPATFETVYWYSTMLLDTFVLLSVLDFLLIRFIAEVATGWSINVFLVQSKRRETCRDNAQTVSLQL